MATSVPRDGGTGEVIEREALALFHAKGYHATSIRDIAAAAQVVTSTLFHHFGSKEEILQRIMQRSLAQTIERVQRADAVDADPRTRLSAVVTALVLTHTELQRESFVNNSELRSLSPGPAQEVVATRRHLAAMVTRVVADGCASGAFDVERPAEAATAIITMVMAVATWFRPSGPRTAEEIAASYVVFALRLVGAPPPPADPTGAPQTEAEEPAGSVRKSSRSALRVMSQ